MLLLAVLFGRLQELVLLADKPFEVRVSVEAARNTGEVLFVRVLEPLVCAKPRHRPILCPGRQAGAGHEARVADRAPRGVPVELDGTATSV